MAFIFNQIPLTEVVDVIASTEPVYFVLAVLMRYLQRIVMAYRTRVLARHQSLDLPIKDIVGVGLVATFYGVFLPGTLAGGAVRWYRFNKIVSKPSQVLVMILFDRLIDTVFMASLGLIFFFGDDKFMGPESMGEELTIAVVVFAVIYLIAFNKKITKVGLKCLLSIAFIPVAIKAKLRKVADAAILYSDMSLTMHVQLFLLSVLVYTIGVLAFVFLAIGLNLELGFATVAWITSLVTAILMLPITFSGLGVREAGLIVVLGPYGIDAASALAYSLLMFSSLLMLALGGGVLELYQQYFTPNNKVKNLKEEDD